MGPPNSTHAWQIAVIFILYKPSLFKPKFHLLENRATVNDPETLGAGRVGGWTIRRIKYSAKWSCLLPSKHICFSGIYLLNDSVPFEEDTHKDRMLIIVTPSTTSYL